MRRRALLLLAFHRVAASAATRPRYGGTLRVQLLSMFEKADAIPLVSETLVRIDEHEAAAPVLARTWQADTGKKRWRFTLRSKTAADAAAALSPVVKRAYADATVSSTAQAVMIQSDRPMPDLLERLAAADAGIPGTGPFRIGKFEPGRRAVLEANEDYPGGRPFLDAVEFTSAPPRVSAYQAGSADLWQVPVGLSRRLIPDGMRVWTSMPLDLIALVLVNPEAGLREVLSCSIDRAAIVNVLTQRRGEVAQGLLPQWLSGYEFLFNAPFDPGRARRDAAVLKSRTLVLGIPAADPLARSIADRVMVNARDAGLALQVAQEAPNANIQLVYYHLNCSGAARALREITGQPFGGDPNSPEALYQAERRTLDEGRLIPLLHVPQVWGIGARVRSTTGLPQCDLMGAIPNMWLAP